MFKIIRFGPLSRAAGPARPGARTHAPTAGRTTCVAWVAVAMPEHGGAAREGRTRQARVGAVAIVPRMSGASAWEGRAVVEEIVQALSDDVAPESKTWWQ